MGNFPPAGGGVRVVGVPAVTIAIIFTFNGASRSNLAVSSFGLVKSKSRQISIFPEQGKGVPVYPTHWIRSMISLASAPFTPPL